MKNLLEVSEIIDNAIIDEYLSKLDKTKQMNVLHWFTRERQATTHETNPDEIMLGRPPVFKLANRIESYVDINQKMVLNKHGRPLTTVKIDGSCDESDSSRTTEKQLDPLDSGFALDANDAEDNRITGIMV